MAPSNKIVVGVDGSETSLLALRWAAAQARMTGVGLHVLTSWEVPGASYPTIGVGPAGYDPVVVARSVAEDAISGVLGSEPDLPVAIYVPDGHPAPALVEAAASADLLVVGGSGHGALIGMLLGSVTAYCTQHAPCPVVVVRG